MVRSAVILAAGRGTRLGSSVPKPIVRLGVFRLFMFPIVSLIRMGVRNFVIIASRNSYRAIRRSMRRLGVRFSVIVNNEVLRENGYSFYLGLLGIHSNVFFVTMSDHVFVPEIPEAMISAMEKNVDVLVAADSSPIFADIDESTKILARDEYVVKIGKNLDIYNYVDAGLFIFRKRVLSAVEEIINRRYTVRLSDIINYLVEKKFNVRVVDISGLPWLDVDTKRELKKLMKGKASVILDRIFNLAR